MLRAITSYFFGEIQDQAPEAAIECETQEVNDWLVVNLPDHNKEEIDLDDEDKSNEMDGDDTTEADEIEFSEVDENDQSNDPSDADESDTSEEDADDTSGVDESEDEEDCATESWPGRRYEQMLRYLIISRTDKRSPRDTFLPKGLQCFEKPQFEYQIPPILRMKCLVNTGMDCNETVPVRKCEPKKQELVPVQPPARAPNTDFFLSITAYIRQMQGMRPLNEYESKFRNSKAQSDDTYSDVTVTSKDFVNHRHPEKPLNNDLLQRIKELEPEQQAVQRSMKKNITRGQLNRQNKNYMYDTSSKRNRRCNRQRNHSGANNNRKC